MFSRRRLWRMSPSGMLCCVDPLKTNVSAERNVSIIRVTRIDKLGTILEVTSNRRTLPHGVTFQKTTFFNDWLFPSSLQSKDHLTLYNIAKAPSPSSPDTQSIHKVRVILGRKSLLIWRAITFAFSIQDMTLASNITSLNSRMQIFSKKL
jgi:hypothetical protein